MENQVTIHNQNLSQADKHQTQSLKTYRDGNDVFEIETICELKKTDFFEAIYSIQKIKERKYQSNFKTLLASVMVKISVLAGIKNEIDDLTKQDISKMIVSAYAELAIEEIYKAFELERYGVYEEKTEHFQMFDSNYISTVLKKYKNWKINEKKILNFQVKVEAPPEIDENEKTNLLKAATQNRYEEFLKNDFIVGKHDHIFDFLVEKNKIIVSNNPKNKEWFSIRLSIAKRILLESFNNKIAISKNENDSLNKSLEEIKNGKSDQILIKAKEIILKEYFEKQADLWITNIF